MYTFFSQGTFSHTLPAMLFFSFHNKPVVSMEIQLVFPLLSLSQIGFPFILSFSSLPNIVCCSLQSFSHLFFLSVFYLVQNCNTSVKLSYIVTHKVTCFIMTCIVHYFELWDFKIC